MQHNNPLTFNTPEPVSQIFFDPRNVSLLKQRIVNKTGLPENELDLSELRTKMNVVLSSFPPAYDRSQFKSDNEMRSVLLEHVQVMNDKVVEWEANEAAGNKAFTNHHLKLLQSVPVIDRPIATNSLESRKAPKLTRGFLQFE